MCVHVRVTHTPYKLFLNPHFLSHCPPSKPLSYTLFGHISYCYGLNACVPLPDSNIEALTPSVAIFGDGSLKEVIKVITSN